ncbi:hypothetical protein BDP27DRAFT_985080 [Rhodocollybia butyracea]|uniref:MYND-type domain-containing protein n=1 Tax=Rhodocollybia butyracea TaxID=206335 RepID=A0A9P5U5H6_9AGAR|nr:hypothetical protein BDP27DRAFT_985080 [Rhodocollybia butyracea]
MSKPLYWPGEHYFYPTGNTPAVSLTRDLPPETSANILLLGCGDPRNILFTIYNEYSKSNRCLDITCSDIDPAILARNIVLFSMLIDGKIASKIVWSIFFDTMLDSTSYSILVEHCQKLYELSLTQEEWRKSPYGSLLLFSTSHSLEKIRYHWKLYVDMETLPLSRRNGISNAFLAAFSSQKKEAETHVVLSFSAARSAGPLLAHSLPVLSEHYQHYRTTGVTSTDPKVVASATQVNPMFVYSLGGEGYNVHYGTSPLIPFHFAPLFGNAAKKVLSAKNAVEAAMEQFRLWSSAYRTKVSTVILRFLVGEATSVSKAFQALSAGNTVQTRIPVAQWQATMLEFDAEQYAVSGPAPKIFDVIDTSNLVDDVGLLNVLISAIPLRKSDGIIYTESLVSKEEDSIREFKNSLFADLGVITLLLGVAPLNYMSGFLSRSNVHEVLIHTAMKSETPQFQEVTTWKSPTSSDDPVMLPCLKFDTLQLGTFLADMYQHMFEDENPLSYYSKNRFNQKKAITTQGIIHYNCEAFVLLVKLIQSKLAFSQEEWDIVMERFFHDEDAFWDDVTTMSVAFSRMDLESQMYQHGVYTVPGTFRQNPIPKIGIFSGWSVVPHLVRVVFSVPRQVLNHVFQGKFVGTPFLQCKLVFGIQAHAFTSVHATFGRVTTCGTAASPRISLEEDKEGWRGTSPLIVSFTVPTQLITTAQKDLLVRLSIMPGVIGTHYAQKLGDTLAIFSAPLLDRDHVHIVPEPLKSSSMIKAMAVTSSQEMIGAIGECNPVEVIMDDDCELATSFCAHISVKNSNAVHAFAELRANPEVKQTASCSMRLSIGGASQDVLFPFPVKGAEHRLRVARKSLYIEIIVPLSGPLEWKIRPFPVLSSLAGSIQAWNIHYLNLSCLPTVDCSHPEELSKWLNPHVGSMMSKRDRSLKKKQEKDMLMFVKDSLHSILVRSSGIQGVKKRRLFALTDGATNNVDTIIFVNGLLYDPGAHTVVCEAYVLPPLTENVMEKHRKSVGTLFRLGELSHTKMMEGELASWKHLLPSFVERCRTWNHRANCEYKSHGSIPLTEAMDSNPLCSCGEGMNVDGMLKNPLWRPFAPHVTRIALSPLFAVTYLDSITKDPNSRRCWLCRGKGKPKLQECAQCQKVRYCGSECQKKDWPVHRKKCKKVPV